MINQKYSYKDFTRQKFKYCSVHEFDGDIVGSCFYQENTTGIPDYTDIFPEGITSNFVNSNMDNVMIPVTATLENSSNRRITSSEEGDFIWP
jgi:hypothetical protein